MSTAFNIRPNGSTGSLLLGYTKNGQSVLDRPNSHCHLPRALLRETLGRIELLSSAFSKVVVSMERVVGTSACVTTSGADEIVFARRERRPGLTRFVKGRTPSPCSTIVVILKPAEDASTWILITAFIGDGAEPEPWDYNATPQSVAYWNSHALVWGSEPVIPGSETNSCPW